MRTMGNQGREFVEKYYDRRKIAEHLLCIIENVVLNDSNQRRSI